MSSRYLEFELDFVKEVSNIGVVSGIGAGFIGRACFEEGVEYCVRNGTNLQAILTAYIPDRDSYKTLIKGSKRESGRGAKGNWAPLSDGYWDSEPESRARADQALQKVASLLGPNYARDPAYLRRIVLALGAAALLGKLPPRSSPHGASRTAVGNLLSATAAAMGYGQAA